ncbi:MAG: hypothetical protein GY841_05905 [FCB group bacterium]|nr:hypothetical protein [FCB group bacterium]
MKLFTAILTAGLVLTTGIVFAQTDPIGKVDTVTLYVETLAEGKWQISAHVFNDENIAAIDIPIKYTAGIAKLKVDSVSFVGTRMENFDMKNSPIDTTGQMMRFGGIAYMSPKKPPMPPGNGEIARIYISAVGDKKPGPFAVDTTTYPPNAVKMMLVDENAKTIIPALKIIAVEKSEGKAETKKKSDK